jgi:hypothetical protein
MYEEFNKKRTCSCFMVTRTVDTMASLSISSRVLAKIVPSSSSVSGRRVRAAGVSKRNGTCQNNNSKE